MANLSEKKLVIVALKTNWAILFNNCFFLEWSIPDSGFWRSQFLNKLVSYIKWYSITHIVAYIPIIPITSLFWVIFPQSPWYSHYILLICPSYSHNIPTISGFVPTISPWYSHYILLTFPSYSHNIPIISGLYSHNIPMIFSLYPINRRKFRSQTSDNMDRWKAEQGRGREKTKIRREKSRRERVRRKKIQKREKVGKSRFTVFFQWFVAPEGRKVGSLKRRVRSQLARWEMKNCTPLWREAHFEVKMYKTHQVRTTFRSWDVEKVHAVVARSTFWSQNVQNTPGSDHFWKLRCRKSARRCGAKHISKSKCTKHTIVGPLLEVAMSKKCTPLWREAHFQVKMYKTLHVRATFGGSDVEKVHAVVARSTIRSENVQNTRGSDHFWRFRCRFAASLHYTTLRDITPHSTILHYITLHYTPQHYNYNYTTRLHSTTIHYIKFHYATLHYTTLHYTTLH